MLLSASLPTAPTHPSDRTRSVAALFGLTFSASPSLPLFQNLHIPVPPAAIVLITGLSGPGKSTLLRLIRAQLPLHLLSLPTHALCTLEKIHLPKDRALVDCFHSPLEKTLAHLARAGLSDAHLLLRSPRQLSEGQRFRFRLARFFDSRSPFLFADEFATNLDRTTAKALAWQLHKFIQRSAHSPIPRTAFLATTHTDLTQDLQPHTHLHFTGTEIQLNPKTNNRIDTNTHNHMSIDN